MQSVMQLTLPNKTGETALGVGRAQSGCIAEE